MCLENTLLEKCIRYAVLTGYGTMRLLVVGYYMKPVSDSHSSIWNRILADNELQFVSQSVNRIHWLVIINLSLQTKHHGLTLGTLILTQLTLTTPMSGV